MTYEVNTEDCPTCGAKAGETCRFKSGKRLMRIHPRSPFAPESRDPVPDRVSDAPKRFADTCLACRKAIQRGDGDLWMDLKGNYECPEDIHHYPEPTVERPASAPIPEEDQVSWLKKMALDFEEKLTAAETTIARLVAEKQAAHTEGWNAAIDEAVAAGDWKDIGTGYQKRIILLRKPTAAKPEPSPSSANRAEGRP